MTTVTTMSGDTWDLIAWRIWGDGADQEAMAALIDANPDHVEAAVFDSNVELNVPDIEEDVPISIPPWRE